MALIGEHTVFTSSMPGAQGPPGPRGPPGVNGAPGAPGTTDWNALTNKPATFPPDAEAVDDRVAGLLMAGTNITLAYNDAANTLTINSTASGGGSSDWADITNKPATFPPDTEAVDDRVAGLLTAGTNITLAYNDAANTLTINSTASGGGTPGTAPPIMDSVATVGTSLLYSRQDHIHPSDTSRAPVSHTHTAANVTDFSEAVDDRVGTLLVAGTNVTLNYNDAAGSLTINSSASAVTPAALTKGDDTNVTLTLGGTPATALLQASSITAGWAGTLAAARGGFGMSVAASNGVPLFATGVPTFTSTTGTGNFVRAADPALTGNPTAPTQTAGDNDTSIATTAFVTTAVAAVPTVPPATVAPLMDGAAAVGATTKYAREDHVHPIDTSRAPLASPTFTGDPKAPTPTAGDSDTSIATTAFVATAITNGAVLPATVAPLMNGAAAVGTTTKYAREDHVHPTDTSRAPLASPTFTGDPKAPTPTVGDNDTSIATTAFVTAAIAAGGGVSTVLVSETPPVGAPDKSMWLESDTGVLYLRYTDANSAQWIGVSGPAGPAGPPLDPTSNPTVASMWLVAPSPALYISKSTGTNTIQGAVGVLLDGSDYKARWDILAGDAAAETGSNAGTNFSIQGYADNGTTLLGPSLVITRSTGLITIKGDPTAALGVATKQYVDARGTLYLQNSVVFDPPSQATNVVGVIQTLTVTGAALGDFCQASFSVDLNGMTLLAWVSATNTVKFQFQNKTAGTLDLASGTVRVRVWKQ